jgi:hypothetical protein
MFEVSQYASLSWIDIYATKCGKHVNVKKKGIVLSDLIKASYFVAPLKVLPKTFSDSLHPNIPYDQKSPLPKFHFNEFDYNIV